MREVEDKENPGGVLAKYLISRNLPDYTTVTIKRLARFMKNELGVQREEKRLMDPFWLEARSILKTALMGHKVSVNGNTYLVKRVEAYPDYEILFEREGAEHNGDH